MKKEDFEGPTWDAQVPEIGTEKVKIDGFTFDKNRIISNPFMLLMLLIVMDPTEKQKELLEKFEVVFTDDNKKQVFPKVDVEAELAKLPIDKTEMDKEIIKRLKDNIKKSPKEPSVVDELHHKYDDEK